MKKIRISLIIIFYFELLCLKKLSDVGIRIEGEVQNAIGVLLALFPLILFLISFLIDKQVSKKVKFVIKISIGFIAFCYIITCFMKLIYI